MSEKKKKKPTDAGKAEKKSSKSTTKEKKEKEPAAPAAEPVPAPATSAPALETNLHRLNPIPGELFTDRILTHYDETAGIAIPRTEVEQHLRLGNVVVPLVEAYSARYEKLRASLTTKLLPKRELLLQYFRKLQQTLGDVDAKRKIIEKETLQDTEQILQRLKSVVSLRESSIQHELIHIEDELQNIERLMKRVERANLEDNTNTSILLTSAHPTTAPVQTVRLPRALTMVEIIQEYSELNSSIAQLSNKNIQIQVDFPFDDFPRETSERLEVISRCDKYVHAMNVKDHMLWTALQDKDSVLMELQKVKDLNLKYAEEMAKWAELAHDQKNECDRLKLEKRELEKRLYEMHQVLRSHNLYYEPS